MTGASIGCGLLSNTGGMASTGGAGGGGGEGGDGGGGDGEGDAGGGVGQSSSMSLSWKSIKLPEGRKGSSQSGRKSSHLQSMNSG